MAKSTTTTNTAKKHGVTYVYNVTTYAIGKLFNLLLRVINIGDSVTEVAEAHAVTYNKDEMKKLEDKHPNLREELSNSITFE